MKVNPYEISVWLYDIEYTRSNDDTISVIYESYISKSNTLNDMHNCSHLDLNLIMPFENLFTNLIYLNLNRYLSYNKQVPSHQCIQSFKLVLQRIFW